ncbi:MAG: sugar phosphate isomerase/epimerase [Vicinamibacteria bacterium]|nr:sugar phosphate isomerase/epimerase [Vicinamibacteria bacterium]
MNTDVSRRAFFGAVASAAALPALAGAATSAVAAPALAGKTLKLGVASYSMRKFTLEQALDMARTLGIQFMTFKDVHIPRTDPPETTRALRAKIQAAGITIMGGGTITMENDPVQIRKDFVYAKDAGMPLVYASPDPGALDVIESMVKEYDVKLVIHNHGPEDKWWPAPKDAYTALKTRDKRMGLCIDIGHTIRTGTDPVQACIDYQDRLYDMHVKDLKVKTDKDSQVEVGRGVLDFPGLFRTLLKIGYQGQVGLEYEIKADDPLPGMQESVAYMRGVLAALTT